MLKAEVADKELITKILSKSFEANQSVNYIVRQDNKKTGRIDALMEYSFEVCSLFGDVFFSDDHKACALLLYPQNKRTTIKSIWLDVKLITQAIGFDGIGKALERESKIKAKQSKEPMIYLWFIGVNPSDQHKGIGSKLLQDVIAFAEQKKLPIFLETSTLTNLPWYERFGFKIYDRLELTYTLYFLKRDNTI